MTTPQSLPATLLSKLTERAGEILLLILIGGIWLFHFPLANDGPGHIYSARVTSALLSDLHSRVHELYTLNPDFVPNWMTTALLIALLKMFSTVAAAKVVITLILVLSFAAYRLFFAASASGRHGAMPGILALLFSNTWFLWMGFWNFTLGTALAVLFACYARRHWQDWNAARTAILMVATAVIVATHIIPALFFSYLLLLLLLGSPTGNLQLSLPSPRHRAVIAVAIVPIVALALYATKNHSHAAIFNTSPRGILQAILYYPSTAFDVIRVPYVDAEYATAALALVVLATAVTSFTKRGVSAMARSPYFAGGFVMLLASIVLNDGQGGGAFLQGRLALFSFTLFVAWALAESPAGPLLSVATMLIVVSGAFGVMALITQFRDLDAYTKEVMGAIQAVNPRPGARFVTVRYETPTIEKTYGMQRLRMPYLAAEAVGWDADPDKIVNMTTVEPTTIVFPVHLRLPDSCLMEIQAMAEVSIDGHSHDLEQFLACTPIDNVVVVGEYGADWMPRPDEPGLFGVLERGGFVLAGIQGNPPYIRIFAKAPQSN